jgi:phosphoribosyl 1,2-cyclic phosphate phosphodiesterase
MMKMTNSIQNHDNIFDFRLKVTVLGCGASVGVPMLGIGWGACDPQNPKNHRSRASILVEWPDHSKPDGLFRVLVDTGPDLRTQLLPLDIKHIDCLLYTHAHADHLHGLDDVRGINLVMQKPILTYAKAQVIDSIKSHFAYAVYHGQTHIDKPCLDLHELTNEDTQIQIGGKSIQIIELSHGKGGDTIGFRIDDFAYCTDVHSFKDGQLDRLMNVDCFIIDALRKEPHPAHSHLSQSLGWAKSINAKQTFLTHMNNYMDYDQLCAELPDHVRPAFDGQVIYL